MNNVGRSFDTGKEIFMNEFISNSYNQCLAGHYGLPTGLSEGLMSAKYSFLGQQKRKKRLLVFIERLYAFLITISLLMPLKATDIGQLRQSLLLPALKQATDIICG